MRKIVFTVLIILFSLLLGCSSNNDFSDALRIGSVTNEGNDSINFGADENAILFEIFNSGADVLKWELLKTADWIQSVSVMSGTLKDGQKQAIVITIDRELLKSGENRTIVYIISDSGSRELTVIATNTTQYTTLNTLPISNLNTSGATLNAEILTEGYPKYTERGFVYSEQGMPTLETTIRKVTVPITDEKRFSVAVSGLTQGTTYYVRAYAINAGEISYSTNEVSFIPSLSIATVTTDAVTNLSISSGTATLNGTIVAAGDPAYTERGFVYSLQHNPTIEYATKIEVVGRGLGAYSTNVSNLLKGETYYIRAYAINEIGTAYGEEQKLVMELSEYDIAVTTQYAGYTYKCVPIGNMTWKQATRACVDLTLGGYDDWYLPNKEEMLHILQHTAIAGIAEDWWTSSQYGNTAQYYYVLDRNFYFNYPDFSHNVCAVRKYKE